jgi:hypothetical protein
MLDTPIILPSTLASFLLTSFLIEMTPGPNMTYLALVSASDGRRAGFATKNRSRSLLLSDRQALPPVTLTCISADGCGRSVKIAVEGERLKMRDALLPDVVEA